MAREKTPSEPGIHFTSEQLDRGREVRANQRRLCVAHLVNQPLIVRKIRIEKLAKSLFGACDTDSSISPEITATIDVATRRILGWSLNGSSVAKVAGRNLTEEELLEQGAPSLSAQHQSGSSTPGAPAQEQVPMTWAEFRERLEGAIQEYNQGSARLERQSRFVNPRELWEAFLNLQAQPVAHLLQAGCTLPGP
jgi:hypothetical protein